MSYRPDVILLDLGIPVLGGLDEARELRRHREMAAVQLVGLMGWGQSDDVGKTNDVGLNHHLTKPTDAETLEALLDRIVAVEAA